jgi:predicted DCC family thiol-disulfide oxidoreductase YuxK
MAYESHSELQQITVMMSGECNFCLAQIERIRRLDKNGLFEYLARQDPTAEIRFPVLRSIDFNKGMRLIVPGSANYGGADALYQIARRLPVVSAIAWLYCVPGINQLAKAAYVWVAKNRSWLRSRTVCGTGTCGENR